MIRLHPGFNIQGTAFNPEGKPAAKALVSIAGNRDLALPLAAHRIWTDEDGRFASKKLHPGVYRVRLEAVPEFSGMSSHLGGRRVFIVDRDVGGIELGASPASASLSGKLTDRWKPIAGAFVSMVRKTPAFFLMAGADIPDFTAIDVAQNAPVVADLPNPVPADSASLARGQVMYERACAVCHGNAGIGAQAYIVAKHPILPAYNVSGDRVAALSDGYIYGLIRVGRGLMPPYGHQVSHFDRWHIVNYVRYLQRGGQP